MAYRTYVWYNGYMLKGMKFRIYPNKTQVHIIESTFGCCRLIYNCGLSLRDSAYKDGRTAGYKETSAMLTDMKHSKEFAFLKDVDAIALQQSLRDLDKAYKNFFGKELRFQNTKVNITIIRNIVHRVLMAIFP